MRKIIYIMLLMVMTASCHDSRKTTIDYPIRDISKIEIKYIDGGILTLISITCESFEAWGDLKCLNVEDTATIAKIMYLIDEAAIDSTYHSLDTRRQLKVHWHNGIVETICMSGGIIQRKGNFYVSSDELVETIEFLLPERYRYP